MNSFSVRESGLALSACLLLTCSAWAKEPDKPNNNASAKVDAVYRWIFQFGRPISWRETLTARRTDLSDQLYNLLREESSSSEPIDFDPFLDQIGDATSYTILPSPQRDEVKVRVQGATSRVITVHCVYLLDWRIDNLEYQWSTPQDICSLLLAKRKPRFTY